jgi:nucleotide-binding universal stress UspA family protein
MKTHVPLRSILLATNLADMEWLFPFTCSLAEESGAHITVLHVITALNGFSIDTAGNPYYKPQEAIAAATESLRKTCCSTCGAKVQSEVIAIDGSPTDGILAMASQIHADLVVMGTRCNRGVDKWLRGSVAEQVLRSSPIPVVTVGPRARVAAASGRPIKSILFAASLQAGSADPANANLIYQWTERLKGHLTLLHVLPGEHKDTAAQDQICRKRAEQLRGLLPDQAFRDSLADTQVRTGKASCEILAAAGHTDLIMLGALRNPLLGRFAAEGTLYKVIAEALCPVATLHSEHCAAGLQNAAKLAPAAAQAAPGH